MFGRMKNAHNDAEQAADWLSSAIRQTSTPGGSQEATERRAKNRPKSRADYVEPRGALTEFSHC